MTLSKQVSRQVFVILTQGLLPHRTDEDTVSQRGSHTVLGTTRIQPYTTLNSLPAHCPLRPTSLTQQHHGHLRRTLLLASVRFLLTGG